MCGAHLAQTCARCRQELTPGARFCASCGHRVGADAPSPETEPEPTAEPEALAERRQVSVLFVDLAEFTSLAESMDPEDVRSVQSRYFEVA